MFSRGGDSDADLLSQDIERFFVIYESNVTQYRLPPKYVARFIFCFPKYWVKTTYNLGTAETRSEL